MNAFVRFALNTLHPTTFLGLLLTLCCVTAGAAPFAYVADFNTNVVSVIDTASNR